VGLWLSPNDAQRIGSDQIWKERCRQGTGNALHGTSRQGGSEGDALQRNATRATACGTDEANGESTGATHRRGYRRGYDEDIPCDVQRRTRRSKPSLIALKKLNEIQTLKYVNRSG
jgi:hypothetical protein